MQVEQGAPMRNRGAAVLVMLSTTVLALATLACVLQVLSIDVPGVGLDESWAVVLGEAAMRPARWGVDLTFTYGPASALVTRYFTDNYLTVALPLIGSIAIVYALCSACLIGLGAAGRPNSFTVTMVCLVGWVATLFVLGGQNQDAFFFSFSFVVFLLDLVRPPQDRVSRWAVITGVAVMGVIALSKTSFGILALMLFVLSDLRAAWQLRRWPLLTPVFLLAFLIAFAVYGQRFGDLPAYARLQAESVAGYGEAMYLIASRGELLAFLAGAVGLVAITGLAAPGPRISRLVTFCAVVLEMIIALKAGFIRADTHPQISWALLGLVGLAVAVCLVMPRSVRAASVIGVASLLVLSLAAPLYLLVETDRTPSLVGVSEIYADEFGALKAEVAAWGRFVRSPADFAEEADRAKAAAWTAVRTQHPLSSLAGTVDIISSEQSAVLANKLDYHPRPSFQDYATDTAGLIAANAAFYDGASAPDWVLFANDALDDRYPTSIEGALWPALLARYEPLRRDGDWLALHRRATPLSDVLGPPQRLETRLGEHFAVPATPVFAHIVVRKTLLGRLAAAIFRPPALTLRVRMLNGIEQNYRFIPALGAGGFLLSPMVDDASSFALLAFGESEELAGKSITDAVIGGSSATRFFYEPDVTIDLQSVTLKDVAPSREAQPFAEALNQRRPWRQLVRQIAQVANFDGDRLAAPAPTALNIPVAGARHLRLGFGIEDGAWTTGQVKGVCFKVEGAAGGSEPLWQRCLDPHDVATDRGPQTVDVVLPAGLDTASVATTCLQSCDWGWSYWNDIEPER